MIGGTGIIGQGIGGISGVGLGQNAIGSEMGNLI